MTDDPKLIARVEEFQHGIISRDKILREDFQDGIQKMRQAIMIEIDKEFTRLRDQLRERFGQVDSKLRDMNEVGEV